MKLDISSAKLRRPTLALLIFVVATLPGLALAGLNEEQKGMPTVISGANAGLASAIFGDTAVVGAPADTGDVAGCQAGAAAAYVFARSGTIWTKVATLCASDGVAGDQFGAAVSISNGAIAMAFPGGPPTPAPPVHLSEAAEAGRRTQPS